MRTRALPWPALPCWILPACVCACVHAYRQKQVVAAAGPLFYSTCLEEEEEGGGNNTWIFS